MEVKEQDKPFRVVAAASGHLVSGHDTGEQAMISATERNIKAANLNIEARYIVLTSS